MTEKEHNEVREFYYKLSSGANLSQEEMHRLLLLLAMDYFERGLE